MEKYLVDRRGNRTHLKYASFLTSLVKGYKKIASQQFALQNFDRSILQGPGSARNGGKEAVESKMVIFNHLQLQSHSPF